MKAIIYAACVTMFGASAIAQQTEMPLRLTAKEIQGVFVFKASYSCSPRKTCSKTVNSCDEAYWLMDNCSWGHKLDGDNDGVPCENMCPGG